MIKVYDYAYYSLYRNTSIINKSTPKWSTIIALSTLLSFNLISLLIYSKFDVEKIGKNGFGAIPLILIGINYVYFFAGKKHFNILNQFADLKYKLILDTIVLTYACISVFTFIFLLGIELKITLYITGFVALTAVFSFIFYRSRKSK